MARVQTIRLVDDLDGSPGEETVIFGIDGKTYEIDLSETNAALLRNGLTPFVAGGRPLTKDRREAREAAAHRSDRVQNRLIRAWAAEQGMKINERGRIPANVVAAYRAGH